MSATKIVIGGFLGAGLAALALTAPTSTLAQSGNAATTGQQGVTGQQDQQPHKHSHQHARQGTKRGEQEQSPQ
jgi:hypothetical protein